MTKYNLDARVEVVFDLDDIEVDAEDVEKFGIEAALEASVRDKLEQRLHMLDIKGSIGSGISFIDDIDIQNWISL